MTTNCHSLISLLPSLDSFQVELLYGIAKQLKEEAQIEINDSSDIIDAEWAKLFLSYLMIHHALTEEPFTKEKFEYAFVSTYKKCGFEAHKIENRTNRGHDVTAKGLKFSLKTQANKGISQKKVHISKFMELGKGDWKFETLRSMFVEHMAAYDRVLSLRCIRNQKDAVEYELVEIPKKLLGECISGELIESINSRQTPKPGYCKIYNGESLKFELYFDGGTERKLQIKNISKEYCIVHASWKFKLHHLFNINE